MEKDDNEIVVYWSPSFSKVPGDMYDWNMLYTDPVNFLDKQKSSRAAQSKADNYLYCPAFKDMFKNTFEFSNCDFTSKYAVTEQSNGEFVPQSSSYIDLEYRRPSSVEDTKMLMLAQQWQFFCEESLMMEVTPPYFSQAKHMENGAFVPGTFDIGRWFRPINLEFQLQGDDANTFTLPKGDPMFYVKFNTDRKVVLKRYMLTEEIKKVATSIQATRHLFGNFRPLADRYRDFEKSRTREQVLKLIKQNLLED